MKLFFLATAALLSSAYAEILLSNESNDDTHYTAAVVEYSPVSNFILSGLPLVMRNVEHYETLIANASNQGADIIVFPEMGLTGLFADKSKHIYMEVPHPNQTVNPCLEPTKWSEPLVRLSCTAREHRIYVAVNVREQCGPKRHNTDVVFNREGVVVSRYRKLHLFDEGSTSVPDEKDFSVFHTDFGVTFGVAICFDILFREPLSELARFHNVSHFIFSTAWFSEVPFLSAVQVQAAWSRSHNSVLLGSGLNSPILGNTGSGIYAGRMGPLKTIFTGETKTQLLIARVPKDLSVTADSCAAPASTDKEDLSVKADSCAAPASTDNEDFESIAAGHLRLIKDFMHSFSTQVMPLEGTPEDSIRLCHGEFCCSFDIETEIENPVHVATNDVNSSETPLQQYRIFVWDGVRTYGVTHTGGVQLCGVVACLDVDDVMSCGMPVPSHQTRRRVRFSKLRIRGAFESNNTMMLSDTQNVEMLPLPANSFDFTESSEGCERNATTEEVKCMDMTLLRELDEIQSFAIYNRVFRRDGTNSTLTPCPAATEA